MTDAMEKPAVAPPPLPQAGQPAPPAQEALLPSGVTQEMIDGWKKSHQGVSMSRVAGVRVIYRAITREEMIGIRMRANNEEMLSELIRQTGGLHMESSQGVDASGSSTGIRRAIEAVSEVGAGILFQINEEVLGRWDQMQSAYSAEKRINLAELVKGREKSWVFITDPQPYVLTYVSRQAYEQTLQALAKEQAEENNFLLEERMVQHAMIHPKLLGTTELRRMPFGRAEALIEKVTLISGFLPEPAILL